MKHSLFLSLFVILFCFHFVSAQFDEAEITAYYTNDVEALDSTENLRKIEVRINNIDEGIIEGCSVELQDPASKYIINRKRGHATKEGSMDFITFDQSLSAYIIDMGYFPQSSAYNVLIRLEDYQTRTSKLVTLTIESYDN